VALAQAVLVSGTHLGHVKPSHSIPQPKQNCILHTSSHNLALNAAFFGILVGLSSSMISSLFSAAIWAQHDIDIPHCTLRSCMFLHLLYFLRFTYQIAIGAGRNGPGGVLGRTVGDYIYWQYNGCS
jgi:hypothetical protein